MTTSLPPSEEHACWVAWSRLPRLGGRRLLALHTHVGSLARAWQASARALAEVPGWGPGLAAEAVEARRTRNPAAEWAAVARPPIQIVTWLDAAYPPPLRTLSDPPPVLYLLGTMPDWSRAVALVGTREASPYGARIARGLARDLAALGVVVVSGVAAGIDRQAHEGALDVPEGLTVGVLGCGFHHVFPASHRGLYRAIADRCALLSEYPPDVPPLRGHFPYRNRVISGLSQAVIVVEARQKSGSLLTVDHALEQGRQVFAVPGHVDAPGSAGPHALLKHGARLLTDVQDVLDELGWAMVSQAAPTTDDPTELRLLRLLGRQPRAVDALIAESGLSAAQMGGLLIVLELKGLIIQHPGQQYTLV